jgi:hypothetical protein
MPSRCGNSAEVSNGLRIAQSAMIVTSQVCLARNNRSESKTVLRGVNIEFVCVLGECKYFRIYILNFLHSPAVRLMHG